MNADAINLSQRCLNHLHHQLTLSFGHPYGAFSKASSDSLSGEVRASLTFFCFKISKSPNRFTGDVHADVLRCPVRVANQGSYSPGVEDPIKITAGGLSRIGELVAGRLDPLPVFMRLLEPLGGIEGFLQQPCVHLCSSSALGDEPEEHFARINSGGSETPTE